MQINNKLTEMNILSKYLNLERLTLFFFLWNHFIAQYKRNENVCTETNRLTRSVILIYTLYLYVYNSPGTCNTLNWKDFKFTSHSVEYQQLLLFCRTIDKKQNTKTDCTKNTKMQ